MSADRVSLFGFPFLTAATVDEVATNIMADVQASSPVIRFLITPNASTIVYYNEQDNAALKSFYSKSDYILADGMPVVWTSRLKRGQELPARLTGSDLFPVLWGHIRRADIAVVMVLSNEQLGSFYQQEYSHCSTIIPKMFDAGDDAYLSELAEAIVERVVATRSRFLFLGLNFPKQEKLGMAVERHLIKAKVQHSVTILLLGASFEFYAGVKARAPLWMQRGGLEWLYRFAKEPARLAKRYTVDNLRFLLKAMKELL